MSVCRKLPDGTIQKIAGHTILLDANVSEVRQGNITIPISQGNEYVGTVTFSDPMPDNDYVVVLNISAWNNDGNIYGTPYRVDNKTTTGFKIRGWKADPSQTTQITFEWTAFKPIKLDGYTELQNKVNNPDDTPTINSMNLVTSDGVARAIENASAVWKGTKAAWNALPAAEKQTYDLAVLLDQTLVKAVDREDGTETDVANLNKIFRGTKAEWEALSATEKAKYDQAEVIDEYTGVPVVVDKVESGNLNPVTSNAVAKITNHGLSTLTWNTTYVDLGTWTTGGVLEKCGIVQFTKIFSVKAGIPTGTIICSGLPKPAMAIEIPVSWDAWDGKSATGGFFLNMNGDLVSWASVTADTNCRINLVYIKAE